MMHRPLNQNKWPLSRTRPIPRNWRMWTGSPPWICLSVYDCETVISDMVAAVFVDSIDVRWACNIEGFAADGFSEGKVDEAGYKRELGFGHAGAGL